MVLLGFSVLKEKLVSHEKCQTIRLPRKYPIRVGDRAYIYWHLRQKDCEKLGEGIIQSVVRKKMEDLTSLDALNDGFVNRTETDDAYWDMISTLHRMHKDVWRGSAFDVITWRWTA